MRKSLTCDADVPLNRLLVSGAKATADTRVKLQRSLSLPSGVVSTPDASRVPSVRRVSGDDCATAQPPEAISSALPLNIANHLATPSPASAISTLLVKEPWFEQFSVFVIVLNCIALGSTDPCDVHCVSTRCQALQVAEHIIFAFFFVEMLVKMVAMGVYGKNSYLAETWNRFDCFIVITGLAEYVFVDEDINISAIRAFRVFRPLRAITRVPSLRLLILLLLDTMPMLGNVLLFCCVVFFVFGIAGVQLLAGALRNRCFFPDYLQFGSNASLVPSFMPAFYQRADSDYVCSPSGGLLTCNEIPLYEKHKSMCAELFQDATYEATVCRQWIGNYSECRAGGPNPNRGSLNFDNIGSAWLAIFQVISLEGWSRVMYLVQDAYSFWIWIYFVALVVSGAFFAVNLCLVVIATQFSETKRREIEKMKSERRAARKSQRAALRRRSSLMSWTTTTNSNTTAVIEDSTFYTQLLDLIAACWRQLRRSVFRCRSSSSRKREANSRNTAENQPSETNTMGTCHSFFHRLIETIEYSRFLLRSLLDHNIVVFAVIGVIFANAFTMGLEHYGQPEAMTLMFEIIDPIFTCFFATEVALKIFAYGFPVYIRDCLNMLDLVTVTINLMELAHGHGSKFSVLRMFRLLRVVKVFRFMPALQRQLYIMLKTIDNIATFFILLSFFLFIFALLGMSLFGCRFCSYYKPPENHPSTYALVNNNEKIGNDCLLDVFNTSASTIREIPLVLPMGNDIEQRDADNLTSADRDILAYFLCPRASFDSLLHSLFTVLQVFTQDAWSDVLSDGIFYVSDWAGLYFVALVTVGNYVLFNLLVAILVEGFSEQGEESSTFEENNNGTKPQISRANSQNLEKENKTCEEETKQMEEAANTLSTEGSISAFRNFFRARSDYSLYVLSRENWCRKTLLKMVDSPSFDNIILFFILANCFIVMMERPAIEENSFERFALDIANYIFVGLFLCEAIVKILAKGFIIGNDAYLRNSWNVLDFLLVNCSTTYAILEIVKPRSSETKILEIFRVLRLLRALRPLRVVNRAPGLKIVVETLLLSVKPIGNVIIICLAFFLVFSVLGVQLFKGCYHRCTAPEHAKIAKVYNTSILHANSEIQLELLKQLYAIETKADCLESGFEWENESYNFDNIFQALMTLFVFATFDGWVDITRNGIDCVGVDKQPRRDHNPWNVVYFVSFLLIILNMFVGVVVHNFQVVQERVNLEFREKRRKRKEEKMLRRLQRSSTSGKQKLLRRLTKNSDKNLEKVSSELNQSTPVKLAEVKSTKCSSVATNVSFLQEYPYWRLWTYYYFTHKYFELVLTAITALNILIMAFEYYQMPTQLEIAVRIIGYIFTALLALEAVAKLIAFGPSRYLADRWNQLDLSIVIMSIVAIFLEDSESLVIPINPTIVRVARIFRIARVFKLLKTASGIRRLLDTVGSALPQVGNLSLFFFLLFFIYASLGVELFGKFRCEYRECEGLSRHANFKNFGIALLTLFRIFTGDDWNGILKDMLRASSDIDECFDLLDGQRSGQAIAMECAVAGIIGPLYFVSFVLIAQFVLINVVVAVLMSQLEEAHRKEALEKLTKKDVTVEQSAVAFGEEDATSPPVDLHHRITVVHQQTTNQALNDWLAVAEELSIPCDVPSHFELRPSSSMGSRLAEVTHAMSSSSTLCCEDRPLKRNYHARACSMNDGNSVIEINEIGGLVGPIFVKTDTETAI